MNFTILGCRIRSHETISCLSGRSVETRVTPTTQMTPGLPMIASMKETAFTVCDNPMLFRRIS
jgi:hypothetical protein